MSCGGGGAASASGGASSATAGKRGRSTQRRIAWQDGAARDGATIKRDLAESSARCETHCEGLSQSILHSRTRPPPSPSPLARKSSAAPLPPPLPLTPRGGRRRGGRPAWRRRRRHGKKCECGAVRGRRRRAPRVDEVGHLERAAAPRGGRNRRRVGRGGRKGRGRKHLSHAQDFCGRRIRLVELEGRCVRVDSFLFVVSLTRLDSGAGHNKG